MLLFGFVWVRFFCWRVSLVQARIFSPHLLNSFQVTCASRHTQRSYPCKKKTVGCTAAGCAAGAASGCKAGVGAAVGSAVHSWWILNTCHRGSDWVSWCAAAGCTVLDSSNTVFGCDALTGCMVLGCSCGCSACSIWWGVGRSPWTPQIEKV